MPEEQATYHTPQTDMPEQNEEKTRRERNADYALKKIKEIVRQPLTHPEDMEGAIKYIRQIANGPRGTMSYHYRRSTERTLAWAHKKGITQEGTLEGQAMKMLEETCETWAAILGLETTDIEEIIEHAEVVAQRNPREGRADADTDAQVRDGFGDMQVTITLTVLMYLRSRFSDVNTPVDEFLMACWCDVLEEEVAERLDISRTTVYEYLRKRHIYE